MSARRKPLHFALTETQVVALTELVYGIETLGIRVPRKHPAITAAEALDDQMHNQLAQWEKCDKCDGSGWVENG